MLAHKKTSLTIENKFNWSRSSGFGDFRGLTLFTHSLLKEDKNRLCSPAANFRAQLTNVTKQQQTLPFQTPYRLQRNRFTWPFNHKMVDLRMIVTKTRLQVNGLVKYNCSTEGNLSRRFNEKKFLVLVSLNGHWHREWNYVLSEITKFNFVKTIMFWAKTMSAKEG